jgi:hypothetical protein
MRDESNGDDLSRPDAEWSFPFEAALHDVFPALHDSQSAWLSQIDSLAAPCRSPCRRYRCLPQAASR